ncbi:MAG: hypothetical protein WAW00_01510 [Candidatus Moraniibacteriota bacterium]
MKRALELGIRIEFSPSKNGLTKLEYGKDVIFLKGSNAPVMRQMGNFTRDKEVTKMIFDAVGIRTPKGIVADSFKSAAAAIKKRRLSYPVILKPTHGSRALGVTWDIRSEKDLFVAFSHFKEIEAEHTLKYNTFLVEEMFIGHEYRVLVLNGKVISCVQKIPASVIGDGISSIKKLISAFNKTRLRGFKMKVDATVEKTLKENGLTLSSILPKKRVLRLRNNLNMSDGGRSIDVTKKMHPFFREICVCAAKAAGLSFGGVDVIAEDIATDKKGYVLLEINPNPYYNMNEKPLVEGRGADVSYLLLKQVFPKLMLPKK